MTINPFSWSQGSVYNSIFLPVLTVFCMMHVQDRVLYSCVLPYKRRLHREDHVDEEVSVLAVEGLGEDYAAVLRSLQARSV